MEGHKTTAKWGEACAQCSAAKAKCKRSNNTPGATCDRYARLFQKHDVAHVSLTVRYGTDAKDFQGTVLSKYIVRGRREL